MEFVRHSYTYHLTRIDHRHNFSVYNTLLHIKSAVGSSSGLGVESLAFFPQLLLSVVAIPLFLAKKDLASTMLAQTFAFVTFNKVCTSQVCFCNFSRLLLLWTRLTRLLNTVLFVVYGVLAILPPKLVVGSTTQARLLCSCPLGHWTGMVVPLPFACAMADDLCRLYGCNKDTCSSSSASRLLCQGCG